MKVLYLETSALLRIVFNEQGAGETERALRNAGHIVSSRLLRVEAERALLRTRLDQPEIEKKFPEMDIELAGIWARVVFIEMTRDICDLAGRIAPTTRLRSLDAIHLATFHTLRRMEPSAEMLSFDARLLAAL
jgi:hypothetical protein